MLFIAASTVTTGELSHLIRQGPDCRRQSSGQRDERLGYPINRMAKHRKSENAPDAKLAPLHIAIQDTDKAG